VAITDVKIKAAMVREGKKQAKQSTQWVKSITANANLGQQVPHEPELLVATA